MRRMAFLMAVLTLAGCDCSGEPTQSTEGELQLGPDLQFGVLGVGERLTSSTALKNIGSARVHVSGFAVDAPFTACLKRSDGSCAAEGSLEVGEEAEVAVTYAPTEPNATEKENHYSRLVVASDATRSPEVSVSLVGHAVTVRLARDPAELDFGAVDVDRTKVLSLTLTNRGVDPIVLSAPALENGAFTAELALLQTTLARGASVTVPVTFAPKAMGPQAGALSFTTDVDVQREVRIPLRGDALLFKVALCYGLEGATPKCLPDDKGRWDGWFDFGTPTVGTPVKGTVVLKNEGNVEVLLSGKNGTGPQVADVTGNPCSLPAPPAPDFAFSADTFGTTLAVGAQEVPVEVTYRPHFDCEGDLQDTAEVWVTVRRTADEFNPRYFSLTLRGGTNPGVAVPQNYFWADGTAGVSAYEIGNEGQGPLRVDRVELVQANPEAPSELCENNCATRAPCEGSASPECELFTLTPEPPLGLDGGVIEIAPVPVNNPPRLKKVATARYLSARFCPEGADAGVEMADGGPGRPCYPRQTVRVCTRITTNDPHDPTVCGELKGETN